MSNQKSTMNSKSNTSTLELYPQKEMKGTPAYLNKNTPNVADEKFTSEAMSLRATGDPWVVFDENIYGGDFHCYEGEHTELPSYQNKICSAKILSGGLENPELVIYEGDGCTGKSLTVYEERRDFDGSDFSGKARSGKCKEGSWILYEEKNLRGNKRIIIAGEKTPGKDDPDHGWKGSFLSARPLTEKDLEN